MTNEIWGGGGGVSEMAVIWLKVFAERGGGLLEEHGTWVYRINDIDQLCWCTMY